MNLALIIIIVIAVILAIFGGLNSALSWLLWVAHHRRCDRPDRLPVPRHQRQPTHLINGSAPR